MKQIGNINNLPEELKNPFKLEHVTDVSVHTFKSFTNSWYTCGSVEFKIGNTLGKQKFEGTDLVDVLKQIYTFVNNL